LPKFGPEALDWHPYLIFQGLGRHEERHGETASWTCQLPNIISGTHSENVESDPICMPYVVFFI
jgi:hypothetical protein